MTAQNPTTSSSSYRLSGFLQAQSPSFSDGSSTDLNHSADTFTRCPRLRRTLSPFETRIWTANSSRPGVNCLNRGAPKRRRQRRGIRRRTLLEEKNRGTFCEVHPVRGHVQSAVGEEMQSGCAFDFHESNAGSPHHLTTWPRHPKYSWNIVDPFSLVHQAQRPRGHPVPVTNL